MGGRQAFEDRGSGVVQSDEAGGGQMRSRASSRVSTTTGSPEVWWSLLKFQLETYSTWISSFAILGRIAQTFAVVWSGMSSGSRHLSRNSASRVGATMS